MDGPSTQDAAVLWSTFHGRYHLPPTDLPQDCVILDLGGNVGYTVLHFAHRHLHDGSQYVGGTLCGVLPGS